MRKSDNAIIWPVYFDANKSKSEGRRVSKNLAVAVPKIIEIQQAVEKIGLKNELNATAGYPKTPWIKMGMLIVEKKESKEQIILKIAKELTKIKSQQQPTIHKK